MLHGLCLHGYAPYAHGLWSGLTEWIIRRIAQKRKSTNFLSYLKQWISFSYHLLSIIHTYNVGTSRLRSHIMASVIDPDSGRAAWLGRYIVPRPSCLGSDIASMTRHRHRTTVKSSQQRHRATTNIALTAPSPAGFSSAVASRTRQHRHQADSVTPSPAGLDNTIVSMTR
jgi:hypothetical protein